MSRVRRVPAEADDMSESVSIEIEIGIEKEVLEDQVSSIKYQVSLWDSQDNYDYVQLQLHACTLADLLFIIFHTLTIINNKSAKISLSPPRYFFTFLLFNTVTVL